MDRTGCRRHAEAEHGREGEAATWFFKRSNRRWSLILLGIWLIAINVLPLVRVHTSGSGPALAILGIAAGILVLLER